MRTSHRATANGFLRTAFAVIVALALAACQGETLVNGVQPDPRTATIFSASMRAPDADGRPGTERAQALDFSAHLVSIPPLRNAGTTLVMGNNPARHLIDYGAQPFATSRAFVQSVAQEARRLGAPREVMIFVHGFNTTHDHALSRVAQLEADYEAPIAKVLFSWPSHNSLALYVHDLDSVYYSRDGLEALIAALSAGGFDRIVLAGHSMGAVLVMETLRQMRIGGRHDLLADIGGVALISPDIDVELFAQMARRLDPLPQPFIVYCSRDDWPLKILSTLIFDGTARLGMITDFAPISDMPIIFVETDNSRAAPEAAHLTTSCPLVIEAANGTGTGLAELGPLAARGAIAGAAVSTIGRARIVVLR